jgi:hypothetical protein
VFDGGRSIRLAPVTSNAENAFLLSSRRPGDPAFAPYSVLVVDLDGSGPSVSRMTVFTDRPVIDLFLTTGGRG